MSFSSGFLQNFIREFFTLVQGNVPSLIWSKNNKNLSSKPWNHLAAKEQEKTLIGKICFLLLWLPYMLIELPLLLPFLCICIFLLCQVVSEKHEEFWQSLVVVTITFFFVPPVTTRPDPTKHFFFFCILSLRVSSKHRGKIMGIVGIHLLWSETPLELKNPPHQRLFSWQSGLLSKQLARMGFVGLELCEVLIQRSSVVLLCSILATCPQHRHRMIHISSFHQWKLRLLTWQCNSYLGYFEVFFFAMFVVCLADISIYPSIDRILTTGTANILRRPF